MDQSAARAIQNADLSTLEYDEIVVERGLVGDRLVARIIDQVVISIIQGLVIMPVYFVGVFIIIASTAVSEEESTGNEGSFAFLFGYFALIGVMILIGQVVIAVYYYIGERRSQQTIGKRSFNLVVVDETGGKPTRGQTLSRAALNALTIWAPLWIAEIMVMAFREDGRRLADMITRTKVIKVTKVYRVPAQESA